MERMRFNHCRVRFEDGPHETIEDALVLVNGSNVKIEDYNGAGRKVQVDRLVDATGGVRGKHTAIFQGRSTHLATQVRVPPEEQGVTITVDRWGDSDVGE